jgi:nicotinate-nucleotide adenylyltransferase
MTKLNKHVAIYSGSFDPIHVGHITFALQALKQSGAEELYFLPERTPKYKSTQELFGHRVAMINRAIKPYKKFKVLELDDRQFTVKRTLPKLQSLFEGQQLVFLFGSDKVGQIETWPSATKLLSSCEFVIGLRESDNLVAAQSVVKGWPTKSVTIIDSYAPNVNSTKIRRALNRAQTADGLLTSVSRYIRQNWLYISLSEKL